jgi:carboxymethylenebutenolidase
MPNINRRQFIILSSLATGYALCTHPLAASTITTDTEGITTEQVQIPIGGVSIPAYTAMPASGNMFPVVLVVHEIFGVHEYIQDVCRRLAKEGYFAIAPALFARQGDVSQMSDPQTIISEVVSQVPDKQVMDDLNATVTWVAGTGKGNIDKLGITGFCWGGRIVWLYAAHNPRVKAGVAWYGRLQGETTPLTPQHPIDIAGKLQAPVLGLYGGSDRLISVESIQTMRQRLVQSNSPSEIVVYPDASHGFHADYRDSYAKEAAVDGWQRLQVWFRRHDVIYNITLAD